MFNLRSTVVIGALCIGVLSVASLAASQEGASVTPLRAPPPLLIDGTLYSTLLRFQPFVLGPLPRATRPPSLPVLYASFIGLQLFDGYSTSHGLQNGATESNVLVRAAVEHPAALWAVKGGASFVSIYAAERLWRRHHKGQAIALMVASNVVMATVAVSNYSATRTR